MSENKKLTRKEIEEQIIKKAQADQDFKKALVGDPKGSLKQLGLQLPAEVEVKVVEESAKVVYLVLPSNPDELTDEQLDAVAGGICWTDWCFCSGLGDFICNSVGEKIGEGACGFAYKVVK